MQQASHQAGSQAASYQEQAGMMSHGQENAQPTGQPGAYGGYGHHQQRAHSAAPTFREPGNGNGGGASLPYVRYHRLEVRIVPPADGGFAAQVRVGATSR